MMDEVEIWGVHTAWEGSWKYERIAYPNWGESERNYFAVFKEEMVTKPNNNSVKFNPYA